MRLDLEKDERKYRIDIVLLTRGLFFGREFNLIKERHALSLVREECKVVHAKTWK